MSSLAMNQQTQAGIGSFVGAIIARLERIPLAPVEIIFRIAMALVFWRSGQTKLANWELTVTLFQEEYKVPVLPPELAAYLATGIELVAPVLLVLGLATRVSAATMLGMTLVIQIFVYPQSYTDHLLWAGPLAYLLLRGPGVISIDYLIRRRFIG